MVFSLEPPGVMPVLDDRDHERQEPHPDEREAEISRAIDRGQDPSD